MRYSNLSNNMMTSELWTTITIQIQYVDGRAIHMTDTTGHQSWQSTSPTPLPEHAGSIPGTTNLTRDLETIWGCSLVF
jgi:hypothetical protein